MAKTRLAGTSVDTESPEGRGQGSIQADSLDSHDKKKAPKAQTNKAAGEARLKKTAMTAQPWPEFRRALTIDGKKLNVNYGSEEEYVRLINEYVLQASTTMVKPGDPKRKFKKCIHCGRDNFANKMRLNKHKWDVECPAVQDEMGNPKHLLPYPDQGIGQGKSSEMLRASKEQEDQLKGRGKAGNADIRAGSGEQRAGSGLGERGLLN